MKNTRDGLSVAGRLIIGGILLYAGYAKAVGPRAEFTAAIMAYRVIPASFAGWIAYALPWIEMWTGLYLLAGYFTRFFSRVAALLFLVFLGVVGSAWIRGIDVASCGCFGGGWHMPPHDTLILDSVLLMLSLWLGRYASAYGAIEAWFEKPLSKN